MSLTQINKAGLDELALDHVFTIGASGSSAYTFQGEGLNGTVNNPTLYLTRGKTYRFENGSGGHPIRIQSTSGASGTAYNTGVTNNAGSGTVIVEVQHDAPDILYYQCTSHAAMNGTLYITGALADGGVTTAKLADGSVTTAKIADDAVTSAKIANGAVTVNELGATSVTNPKLATSSVGAGNLQQNAVETDKIQDANVTTAKIADGAVTNAKLAADAVTTAKIANSAVTNSKLGDDCVTGSRIADDAINSEHYVDGSIDTAHIADQAVTLAKLPHGTSSNDGKFLRANNGADPTFETVSTGAGRNVIVNGAMQVAQRGTSFTNISDTGVIGSVDRMVMVGANLDEFAFAGKQTSDGPDGFSKCFEVDVTTAESALNANDLAYIRYKVEGQDLVPFFNANGTGKNFVLSFYVKALQDGTYQVNIYKNQGPRFISKTYSITSSGAWQRIEIPFTGDTGTTGINDDNGNGFQIAWILVAGTDYTSQGVLPNWGGWPGNSGFAGGQAVNLASSASNYFRITGIQLELGDAATDFEHKSFADELFACQRYYDKSYNYDTAPGTATQNGAVVHSLSVSGHNYAGFPLEFSRAMRTSPTITLYSSNTGNTGKTAADSSDGSAQVSYTGNKRTFQYRGNDSSGTGKNVFLRAHYTADAEL